MASYQHPFLVHIAQPEIFFTSVIIIKCTLQGGLNQTHIQHDLFIIYLALFTPFPLPPQRPPQVNSVLCTPTPARKQHTVTVSLQCNTNNNRKTRTLSNALASPVRPAEKIFTYRTSYTVIWQVSANHGSTPNGNNPVPEDSTNGIRSIPTRMSRVIESTIQNSLRFSLFEIMMSDSIKLSSLWFGATEDLSL